MKHSSIKKLTISALFMGMTIIMSMSVFSVPVPGGHMYLNDIIIVIAAILLDPLYAFIVGGIGAFLGDFFFYPTPMFVSLAVHGLQAVIISLFSQKRKKWLTIIGVVLGCIITIVGYSLGRAFIYSTPEYALLKLPYQILQNVVGSSIGILLTYMCGLIKLYDKLVNTDKYSY